VLAGEGFLQQSHGFFLRRCRLAGDFLHQSHGGFLHQFSRPDKATLKQQKLELENFGFSVFPQIPTRIKKLEGGWKGGRSASPPDASLTTMIVVFVFNSFYLDNKSLGIILAQGPCYS